MAWQIKTTTTVKKRSCTSSIEEGVVGPPLQNSTHLLRKRDLA